MFGLPEHHANYLPDAQEKYAEAETLYRRALAIDTKACGPDCSEVATDLGILGMLLHEMVRLVVANSFKREWALFRSYHLTNLCSLGFLL